MGFQASAVRFPSRDSPRAKTVVLEVWDRDPQPPVLQELSNDSESGRGLLIVTTLADCWDYYPEREDKEAISSRGLSRLCGAQTRADPATSRSEAPWVVRLASRCCRRSGRCDLDAERSTSRVRW
jgi:hypothetical protein